MRKTLKYTVAGLSTAILLTGCGYTTPKYSMSIENAKKLKQVSQKSQTKINVGKFTSSGQDGFIMCRVSGTIQTPNGKSYAEYIKEAIDAELTISDIQDVNGKELTADLTKIELASNPIDAYWNIAMAFNLNGEKIEVENMHKFDAALNADEACKQASNAFLDAAQGVVSTLASDPKFVKLMTTKQ